VEGGSGNRKSSFIDFHLVLSPKTTIQTSFHRILSFQESIADFPNLVFRKIIIPNIIYKSNNNCDSIQEDLDVFCRIITENRQCLEIAASDSEVHECIQKGSQTIYSLLLGLESGLKVGSPETVLDWWLKTGIFKYVSLYDETVSEKKELENKFNESQKLLNEKTSLYDTAVSEKKDLENKLNESQNLLNEKNSLYNTAVSEKKDLDKIHSIVRDTWEDLNIKAEIKTLSVENNGAQVISNEE